MKAGDIAAAFALYRNAQALLASGAGAPPSEKSLHAIAAEAAKAEAAFNAATPAPRRTQALSAAARSLESFFRGEGRIPLGRAWIPADWPSALSPPAIAAVRLSLPPRCSHCAGTGSTPCRSCGGSGTAPCKAQGCKNGWITRKPANTLSPKTDIAIREHCPICGGTGKVRCNTCAGRGGAACAKCGGTGDAPLCKGCHGSGLVDCRDCARTGALNPNCPTCRGSGKSLCNKCGGDGHASK